MHDLGCPSLVPLWPHWRPCCSANLPGLFQARALSSDGSFRPECSSSRLLVWRDHSLPLVLFSNVTLFNVVRFSPLPPRCFSISPLIYFPPRLLPSSNIVYILLTYLVSCLFAQQKVSCKLRERRLAFSSLADVSPEPQTVPGSKQGLANECVTKFALKQVKGLVYWLST